MGLRVRKNLVSFPQKKEELQTIFNRVVPVENKGGDKMEPEVKDEGDENYACLTISKLGHCTD